MTTPEGSSTKRLTSRRPKIPAEISRPLFASPSPTPTKVGGKLRWNQANVDRVLQFSRMLKGTKGRWRGVPLELMDWQIHYVVAPIFGWEIWSEEHSRWVRLIRSAYIEVPRKNGKSTLCSALALFLLAADREPGAEIYSLAGSKEQARIILNPAIEMVNACSPLAKRLECWPGRGSIVAPATGSILKALSSDAGLQHGLNVHGALVDELHVHKSRDQVDAMESGQGSRVQPLTITITTADDGDDTTIYSEKRTYAERVAGGLVSDPTHLVAIYAAPADAEWTDETVWAQANPGLGVTVGLDYLRSQARRAKELPAAENTFRRLHLCQRVKQATRWISLGAWDVTAGMVDEGSLVGARCFGGLDLSSRRDLAAFVLVFPTPGGRVVLPRFWLPSGALELDKRKLLRPTFEAWARQGWLKIIPGEALDYSVIRDRILADAARFELVEVAYDRWGAEQLAGQLETAGVVAWAIPQTTTRMNEPSRALEDDVIDGRVIHGGHPVLRWCVDNAVIEEDGSGRIKPSKRRAKERIDGVVALVNAIAAELRPREDAGPSIYESRELVVL